MKPEGNEICSCGSGKKLKNCCGGNIAMRPPLQSAPSAAEVNALLALFNSGRHVEAEHQARSLLALYPDAGSVWKLLSLSLHMQKKDPLPALQRTAFLLPDDAGVHNNLGNALYDIGQLDSAMEAYCRAVKLKPDFAMAHINLGDVLKDIGQYQGAQESYQRALDLEPTSAEIHFKVGVGFKSLGNLDYAVRCYRRALEIKPDWAEAYNNLGASLKELGQLDAALGNFRRAVELKKDYGMAHYNLGFTLQDLGQLDEAETSYRRALEINPGYAMTHNNLGNLCKDTGRLDEAIACYRRALERDADFTVAHSNLIYLLSFHPGFNDRMIMAEANNIMSSFNKTPPLASAHRSGGYRSDRRLRIGYVSPDFRWHCQSFFTIPLLSNHDHAQFQIFCYAELPQPDDFSKRLRTYSDVWRDTHLKSDQQVAEMIAGDGIDILVDLTMHMAKGRPKLFALKPAPVQVAWLAYPGTTGLDAIDYRLTDPWLDPPELGDERYTEASVRLPDTFWCYDPLISGLLPNALPALTTGHITFGCLNNFLKVSDNTLSRWGEIMSRVSSSRLILLAPPGKHRQRIFDLLGRFGIAPERIEVIAFQPRLQYLQTYHRIDICMDTLPYNGHTTSLDAYWMGVPVVTQVGHTVVGRAGWSQLNNLGLTELAAFDGQTFVDIAVALAADLPRLCQLRQELRGKLEGSPLMDGERFAKAMENTYHKIWESSRSLDGDL